MNAARDTASSRIRTGKATPSDLKYAFRPTDDVARNGADGGGLAPTPARSSYAAGKALLRQMSQARLRLAGSGILQPINPTRQCE